jgi:multiple sugar transport system substrate-binding protein
MLATAAEFEQRHPDVRIGWEARSLQAFGDQPIEDLAEQYDLLVVDHPFTGVAARSGCLVALDTYLPAAVLAEQAAHSVGGSHESYQYNGHQWALAIDAAAQVSAYRSDLLRRHDQEIPRTWDEVLALARRSRSARVAVPLSPVNAICCFLSLCAGHGDPPGTDHTRLADRHVGAHALGILRHLVEDGHPAMLALDPPRTLDLMATTDEVLYCPLLFGYSNYSRPGYAPRLCRFTDIPSAEPDHPPAGAILGGTGLAISSRCRAINEACRYARWVASPGCQRTIYVQSGGQPGNRVAWTDPTVNAATDDFFLNTLATLDRSYLRPRYDGFIAFQDQAGVVLHDYLRTGVDQRTVLDRLDRLYVGSRTTPVPAP